MKKLFIFAFAALGMLACSEGGENAPDPEKKDGALSGKFSVSASTQVQFSQGNLQYQASTKTWRFAENQYDTIGGANKNISATYEGWIDLFGWGTGNNPTLSSTDYRDYQTFTDWGTNAISNGGNKANQWRTLTSDEWLYLFHGRTNAENLFGFSSVNGVNGTILLPDNWTTPSGLVFHASTEKGLSWYEENGWGYYYDEKLINHFSDNAYTSGEWSKMEKAGAVFLPAAGYRYGTEVVNVGSGGYFWSSTANEGNEYGGAYYFYFDGNYVYTLEYDRGLGHSVRLVRIFK